MGGLGPWLLLTLWSLLLLGNMCPPLLESAESCGVTVGKLGGAVTAGPTWGLPELGQVFPGSFHIDMERGEQAPSSLL